MSIRLFSLSGVPDDESDEIRDVLDENNIEYYETPSGNWGLSMAAIWLSDESQIVEASALIHEYQTKRARNAREGYKNSVSNNTFISKYKKKSFEYTFLALMFVVVVYMLFLGVLNYF